MPRRPLHPALRIAGWAAAVLLALPLLLVLALQVDAVGTALFRGIADRVVPPGVELSVQRVSGSWLRGLTLEGVAFRDEGTGIDLTADTVRAGYSLLQWRPGRIELAEAEVVGLLLGVTAGGAREDSVAPVSSAGTRGGPGDQAEDGWTVAVGRVDVRPGSLPDRPGPSSPPDDAFRVSGVDGAVEGLRILGGVAADRWQFGARFAPAGHPDGWGTVEARGDLSPAGLRLDTVSLVSPRSRVAGRGWIPLDSTLVLPGGITGSLEAAPLALEDLQGLTEVPGVLAGDSLSLLVRSTSAGDSAALTVDASTSQGAELALDLHWGRAGERWGGRLSGRLAGLDPRRYLGEGAPAGPLRASVEASGDGRWVDGLRALAADLRVDAATPEIALAGSGSVSRVPGGGVPRDSVSLVVDSLQWGETGLRTGRVWAARSGEEVTWRLDARPLPSGRVRGDGRLAGLGGQPPLGYSGDLRLDSIAEPRSASVLSGSLRIEGEGLSEPSLRSTVALGPSSLAGWPVDTLTLSLSWTGTEGTAAGEADGPRGHLAWALDGHADGSGGGVELRSLSLDSILPVVATIDTLPEDTATARPPLRLSGEVMGELAWSGPPSELADPDRLTASARFRMREVGMGVETLDSLVGVATWQAGRVSARVDAALGEQGTARGRLEGTVGDGLDLRLTEGLLTDVDLQPFVPGAPVTSLNGTVQGHLTRAPGDSLPRGELALRLGPSTLRNDSIRALDLDLGLAPDSLRGGLVAELAGGTVQAELRGPGSGRLDRWTLEADAVLPRLGAFVDQPDSSVSLTGRLTARSEGGTGTEGTLTVTELTGWGARVDTLVARGSVRGGILAVDTLLLRSNVAWVEGGGRIPVTMLRSGVEGSQASGVPADQRMALEVVVPDSAAPLQLGTGTVRVGPSRIRADARCGSARCDITGTATVLSVLGGPLSVLSLDGDMSGTLEPGARLARGELNLDASGIRSPALDVQHATLVGTWDGDEARVDLDATLDDRRAAQVDLRAEPQPDRRRVTLDRLDLQFDRDRWTLTRPAAVALTDEGLALDSLEVTAGEQRILAYVRTAERGRDLVLEVDSLRIAAISDLLDRPDLGGRISGALEIQGSAEVPSIVGGLDASVLRDGAPIHTLRVDALGTGDTLTVSGAARDPGGRERLRVEVSTTLDRLARHDWRADVVADALPLEWFGVYAPPGTVEEVEGALDGRLELREDEGGVQVDGPIAVRGGRLLAVPTDVAYSGIEARITARGRVLSIDSLHVVSRGTADLTGLVTFPDGDGPVELDLAVKASEFLAVDNRQLTTVVGGDLSIDGTPELPRLSGSVQVAEASYRLETARQGENVAAVTLTDEDWAILQSRFGIARPEDREASRWIPRDAILDLSVSLGRDIWLRKDFAPEMAIQFTGDFTATKATDQEELQLRGEIEAITQRSYVEEFGRRFDIVEGTVRLNGPVSEARLAATGRYRVPNTGDGDPVTIRISVTGGTDDLAISLGSEPTLDNADIVSYLATGRPANTAFSGESSTSARDIGIDLVASQLTGSLERFAQQEVGLDVVQIQQDGLQGTTLVAGKYVTPRLFVGFRQGMVFQPEDGHSFSEGLSAEAEAEYQALEWLVMSIRGGTSAIRVFLEGSYGW